jgi:putative spermidine/putrescine transport system permease protein
MHYPGAGMKPMRWQPWLMVGLPAAFLLLCFVAPNAYLLTTSLLKSESQVLTNQVTLENFEYLLGRPLYQRAIVRSFVIGGSVGALVVLLSYPLAFFLARTDSRWRGLLIGLSLTPLLASVVVRTYGWWVLLNRDGAINDALGALFGIGPLPLLPSVGAIIVGLTHSLLPYGVLTLLSTMNAINPQIERAALSLGAGRWRTFREITLPLSMPGVAGAFLLAFSLSISAYATPTILGGPATATMATQIYEFMTTLDDWSLGSAMGAILIASSMLLLVVGSVLGARRTAV